MKRQVELTKLLVRRIKGAKVDGLLQKYEKVIIGNSAFMENIHGMRLKQDFKIAGLLKMKVVKEDKAIVLCKKGGMMLKF